MNFKHSTIFITIALAAFCFSACDILTPETDKLEDGVYSISNKTPSFNKNGGESTVTFVALEDWNITESADWISVTPASGEGGSGSVVITADKNTGETSRSAVITIKVDGYQLDTLATVTQTSKNVQKNNVNKWMADIMTDYYLWNDSFNSIKDNLDYDASYDDFLESALEGTAGNDDDGYSINGYRYYYSYIKQYSKSSSSAPTKADASTYGYGIGFVYLTSLNTTGTLKGFIVSAQYNDSPASDAGLERGKVITKINGENITESNCYDWFYTLMCYTPYFTGATLQLNLADFEKTSTGYTLADAGTATLTAGYFDANPILNSEVFTDANKTKIIGYLNYLSFDLDHDTELMAAFSDFKSKGITDLVIDLRYNGGGYAYQSVMIGTMVAGSSHTGEVYSHMVYNKSRRDKGETAYFYIGKDPSMQKYPNIAESLNSAVGLKKVYVLVTGNTASSSELIINGLRGLDIEVVLVGTTTNGKNVGMEVSMSNQDAFSSYDFGNYIYEFAPITFYNYNAKEFKDFSDGFTPDFNIDEASYVPVPWGDYNNDPLLNAAIVNIYNGTWPDISSAPATKSLLGGDFEMKAMPSNGLKGTLVLRQQ